MGIFSKISGLLKETPLGTLAERAIDRVLPDRLSEAEKSELKMEMDRLGHERDMQIAAAVMQEQANFDTRVKDLEGTASDLKTIPVIGSIVIFARGIQRPVWGFATLWMDFQWFAGLWGDLSEQQQTALIVINTLVLGFLFGERAVKNLTPLIIKVFGKAA